MRPRCVLAKHAYAILNDVATLPDERLSVTVEEDGVKVTIAVEPAGRQEGQQPRWLSDSELLVWNAIKPGEVLTGKEIGVRLRKDYDRDPRLKYVLALLEERDILRHEPNKGYSRMPDIGDRLQLGS